MKKGVALAVGAGEMAQQSPLGHGTSTNLGRAVDVLVQDIMNKNSKVHTTIRYNNCPKIMIIIIINI